MTVLHTDRMTIRRWTLSEQDRAAFHKLNSDPRIMRFYPWQWSRAEADERLETMIANEKPPYRWSVACLSKTGQPIGFTGLMPVTFDVPFAPTVEIGWRYDCDYWGNGYATEAARALMDLGFTTLELDEIVAFAVHDNVSSIAVMKRLGMKHCPAEDFDHPGVSMEHIDLKPHTLFRMTRADWN